MNATKLKMYIAIRRDIPPIHAMMAFGHAALGTYLEYQADPVTQLWLRSSFVKVALMVEGIDELHRMGEYGEHRVFTESRLGGVETCVGFKIVENPHPALLKKRLYSFEVNGPA
jgi:hypothetical protein